MTDAQTDTSTSFATGHDGSKFIFDGRFGEDQTDNLLIWATEKKASDVIFQPDKPVKARIGSRNTVITDRKLTGPEVEGVIKHIYGENAISEIGSGFDLDPSHEIKTDGGAQLRFRINATGGRTRSGLGTKITARVLNSTPPPVEHLNLEPEILENWRPNQGMIIVAGPTGSGKSTLLSSCTRWRLEQEDANEIVLEYSAPIEYVYDDVDMPSSVVWQVEVGRHLRPKFAAGDQETLFSYSVRNALRQAPTIIIVGESRDKATIQAAVEASLTGHLLYTTLHTIGVPETLRRLVLPFPGSERRGISADIMQSLRMVVSQLLLPDGKGGRHGCREFMIFDANTRLQFMKTPVDDWPVLTQRLLQNKEVVGQTMAAGARKLLEAGKIEQGTYDAIEARERGLELF